MKTPRKVNVINLCGGKYVHFGLVNGVIHCVKNNYESVPLEITLNCNIDGLPITKSTGSKFWHVQLKISILIHL